VLVPGVIDRSTNYVEHPELVAQRITRYANIVGRRGSWALPAQGGTDSAPWRASPRIRRATETKELAYLAREHPRGNNVCANKFALPRLTRAPFHASRVRFSVAGRYRNCSPAA